LKVAGVVSAVVVSVVGLFGASQAGAAITERGDDPVVLKGIEVADMLGTKPGNIVGFSYSDGDWAQIPVQVDERHTKSVRSLYPADAAGNPYLGGGTFELEMYADPDTRSGADVNPTFDDDDELVFMGGDAGETAPADARAPEGAKGKTGVKVAVGDPVGGGNGAVYLFKSFEGLDPAAGKDYVDYDFNLTDIGPGENLFDNYGYIHSTNPEDSTVKTDNYELHSWDRWQEDELKVTAGSASGADILDREVAQAFKTSCGRTEYTFSGRWTEDTWAGNDSATDDEGTYIIAKDGPVRALRSYMGANSGPYVQREHVYYASHEQNTIFLRVHPMGDLYSWTDYAPAAIGMTYRDAKNTGGVPVDGNPDTLTPTTSADVANGAYSWQQLSGAQGTVSTVVGAQTDIPSPNFGNYYMDDSTPVDSDQVQCGGDGQAIGSSGFGILGPITPNTDPRNSPFNNLTVERVRYFDAPNTGAAKAAAYTDRVSEPLTGTSSASPIGVKAKLKLKANGGKKAKKGELYKARMKVRNDGVIAIEDLKVAIKSRGLVGGGKSKTLKSFDAGAVQRLGFELKVKPNAKGKKLKLKAIAKGGGTKSTKKWSVRWKS
jgi:hypothetical protein